MGVTRDGEMGLLIAAVDELASACRAAGLLDDGSPPGLTYVYHAAERIRKGERPDPAMPVSPKPKPKVAWTEPTTNRMIDGGVPRAPEREPLVSPGTNQWRDLQEAHAAELLAKRTRKTFAQRFRK